MKDDLHAFDASEKAKLMKLSELFSSFLAGMLDVGAAVHPYVIVECEEICNLLGIDRSTIPTEITYINDRATKSQTTQE